MSYNLSQIESDARNSGMASGSTVPQYASVSSEDGRITCQVVPAQKPYGWDLRATWYLDHKRISRDKLDAFNEAIGDAH